MRVLVAVGVLVPAIALAQPGADLPPPPPPPETTAAPQASPWQLYDEAFRLDAKGDREGAKRRLDELVARYPDHPAAARARILAAKLAAPPLHNTDDEDERSGGPSKQARGELIFWSTLGSVYIAANVCEIIECDSDRMSAATYMVTSGAALAASILLSGDIQQGEAQLYNSAQTWGAWNSLLINDGLPDTRGGAVAAIGMQIAGGASAYGLWHAWRPSVGDVALANTFFTWGTVLGLEAQGFLDVNVSLRATVLIGDAAILGGALMSTHVHMSRGRTLLLDIGGILGSLAGGIVAISSDSSRAALGTLFGGAIAGIGVAYAVTTEWDAPKVPNLPLNVAPMPMVTPSGNTAFGLSAGGSF